MDELTALVLIVSSVAKTLTDILRIIFRPTDRYVPLVAFCAAFATTLAYLLYTGSGMSLRMIAGIFIVSIICTGGAVAVTELQKRAYTVSQWKRGE